MNQQISIILPCYNPVGGWVEKVAAHILQISMDMPLIEVILVNDGSDNDISNDVAILSLQISNLKYISYVPNKGKGHAIRMGLREASGDYIIYTDIDFPYTPNSLLKIYQTLLLGYDVAIGVKDDAYYSHAPKMRTFISKTLRWMSSKLLKISVKDTQCGLKGMNNKGKEIWLDGKIDRYLFDLEAIYKAERKGYKLMAVPVSLGAGVVFSKIRLFMMLTEVKNFLKIYFSR